MIQTLTNPARVRAEPPRASADADPPELGQVSLVFQGGGALGAYQAGVFQALNDDGITPDWVIGTSIGAINAALIAGNKPGARLPRLREFWRRVRHNPFAEFLAGAPFMGRTAADIHLMMTGVQGFFEPNPFAALGSYAPLGPEGAAYYNVAPLERTLSELIDFDVMNAGPMRLTVGAADLRTGEMRYFDTRRERLTARHILASCALPPAFPAVRIDGALYWDGGVLSNTPVEAVFDDNPRRSGLVFAVHLWNPDGPEPDTLAKVAAREKDVRYSSRSVNHIARQMQIHQLRHVVAELTKRIPKAERNDPRVRELTAYGCLTQLHVMRLLAPSLKDETSTKDVDFTARSIGERWDAGFAHTTRVLQRKPWLGSFDPVKGFILHEAGAETMMAGG
jgi:NTE family protein